MNKRDIVIDTEEKGKVSLKELISNSVRVAMEEARSEVEAKQEVADSRYIDYKILKTVPKNKLSGLIVPVVDGYSGIINRIVLAEYHIMVDGYKRIRKNIFIETSKEWNKTYGTYTDSGLLDITVDSESLNVTFGMARHRTNIYTDIDSKKNYIEFKGNSLNAIGIGFILGIMSGNSNNAYNCLVDYIKSNFKLDLVNVDITGYDNILHRCNNILRCKVDKIANRHILLYGEPGNGKSMLAKKIALDNPDYIPITVDVQQGWEKWIPMLSNIVKATDKKILVIIDEIDELGLNRNENRTRVYELLRLLDGTTDLKNIKFIATTNRPYDLDVALLRVGRFTPMFVDNPNTNQRIKIINYYLDKYGVDNIDANELNDVIEDNISGAILRGSIEDCIINNQEMTIENIKNNLKKNMKELKKISNEKDVMYR